MFRTFEYRKNDNEVFNSLIDSALDLARCNFDAKHLPEDYKTKNKELLVGIGKNIVEGTRWEETFAAKGLETFMNPNVRNSNSVRENFNAIIAQITTAIVPEVVDETFAKYVAEVKQVGWGDTPRFLIESNDLFKVNSKAEGVRKGVDQPMYDDEITVSTHPMTVDAHIDWYPFAAGVFDMGNFAMKIGRSYAAYIFLKTIKGMTAASTKFGAAYGINGFSAEGFNQLRDRVSAANGGMGVIAIGTTSALANLNDGGNFQVEVGEEMNKVGYLDQYHRVPLLGLENVLVPGTTNGEAKLALADNIIYLVPAAGDRPVKIVFEGDEVAVSFDPEHSSDKRYGISIELRVGIATICGAKYGTITLGD